MNQLNSRMKGLSFLVSMVFLLSILACIADPDDGPGGGDDTGGTSGREAGERRAENDCAKFDVVADEYIRDRLVLSGCFFVPEDLVVTAEGHLIIEKGSNLQFAPGVVLDIWGAITAKGAEEEPIEFGPSEDVQSTSEGYWQGIRVRDTTSEENIFDFVTIQGAGSVWTSPMALELSNSEMAITNTTIRGNYFSDFGATGTSRLREFSFNKFHNKGPSSVLFTIDALQDIGPGNEFDSDEEAYIILTQFDAASARSSSTGYYMIPNLGLPYHVYGAIEIFGDGSELEIEPGVVLKLSDRDRIEVKESGLLRAKGTAQQPIILGGFKDDGSPAAGSWTGLWVFDNGTGENILENIIFREFRGTALRLGLPEVVEETAPTEVRIENISFEDYISTSADLLIVDARVELTKCSGVQVSADDIGGEGREDFLRECELSP